MISNKKFALAFRLISLVIAVSGIVLTSFGSGDGFNFAVYRYYTIQSNLLAVILFAALSFKTLRSLKNQQIGVGFFPRFEMICVVDLLLTLLVYWIMLAPTKFSMGESSAILNYRNLAVHLITPLLCLADYILFTKSDHLKYSDIFKVAIYPLCYVAFATIIGFSGQTYGKDPMDGGVVRFPYFFIDYDRMGWKSLGYILGLVFLFLIIGHVFYLFDKKIRKKESGFGLEIQK